MAVLNFGVNIYDKEFKKIDIIDTCFSFIWTDRYQESGDFELQISTDDKIFNNVKKDYHLVNPNTEHIMIIESIKNSIDEEKGKISTISGYSLESILKRRVIWNPTLFAGSIEEGIKLLLDTNIISPKDEKRKISNFTFVYSNDHRISKIGIDIQLMGENLYDTIVDICKTNNIGFKITYNFETNNYEFKLYKGIDRSVTNFENNFSIEFSSKNDNLLQSNYVETYSEYKNVALIGGEGEGDKKKVTFLNENKYEGIERRELYIDSSVSSEIDGHKLSTAEYNRQMKEEAKMELKKLEITEAFEGEVLSNNGSIFKFRKDFFVGDIVSLRNEYGNSGDSVITESVESYDDSGYNLTPTFITLKKEIVDIEGSVLITQDNKIFEINGLIGNITIDWGDGNITENITETSATHTYENENVYEFKIKNTSNNDIEFCPVFTSSKVLYTIEIPNGVKTIPENAFKECSSLSDISLPPSLEKIDGTNAFDGCTSLYYIMLPNAISSLGQYCFNGCSNLVSVNFPFNCKEVPEYFFNNCSKIRKIDFPGNTAIEIGVEKVNANAMKDCKKLSNITFGSKITYIDGTCTNGTTKSISIECLSNTPPSLSAPFSGNIGSITVPTSPNFDDSILNAYKSAANWSSYGDRIKEKESKEDE